MTNYRPFSPTMPLGDVIEFSKVPAHIATRRPDLTLVVRREAVRLFSALGFQAVVPFEDAAESATWVPPLTEFQANPWDRFKRPGQSPRQPTNGLAANLRFLLRNAGRPRLWADDSIDFNPDHSRLQVGLCWRGSGRFDTDGPVDSRCVPPELLFPLLDVPNVEFFALHFEDHAQAMPELQNLTKLGVWDFAGTAGVMKKLDLVITIDTSVAHLSGTLGVPTWLMLMHKQLSPDPRWNCLPAIYPSVRKFRQPAPYDWEPVIERIAAELVTLAASHQPRSDAIHVMAKQ